MNDFYIYDGTLKAYRGKEETVDIPDTVVALEDGIFEGNDWIKTVRIPDSVKSIGARAFCECIFLTAVNIPKSVTEIGKHAFRECPAVTEFTVDPDNPSFKSIDGNLYTADGKTLIAYAAGKKAESFIVPPAVTRIGECAFSKCGRLENITFHGNVSVIGKYAFEFCTSLRVAALCDGITEIADYAFSWCEVLKSIRLPDSLSFIGEYAFIKCQAIKEICLPRGITEISRGVFSECASLEKVTFGGKLTRIGMDAFNGCERLCVLDLPETLTEIGESAFRRCLSFRRVTVPNSVTHLGPRAFASCRYLSAVTLPRGLRKLSEAVLFECSSLTALSVPPLVTEICANAVRGCSSLTAIDLPESVEYIGEQAFSKCSSLTDISLPEGIKSIGTLAFSGCDQLESIHLPASLQRLNSTAFNLCRSLTRISVEENSSVFRSTDGDLYSKDGKTLVFYAPGKTAPHLSIPDGVESLRDNAVTFCRFLHTVTVPDSVRNIAPSAFMLNIALKAIFISPEKMEMLNDETETETVTLKCINGCLIRYSENRLTESEEEALSRFLEKHFGLCAKHYSTDRLFIRFATEKGIIPVGTAERWLEKNTDAEIGALLLDHINRHRGIPDPDEKYKL